MTISMVSLREIATQVSRPVPVEPGISYRTFGVQWWGKGAYERETIDGSQTAAKTLFLIREGDLVINKIWVRHGSAAIASEEVDGCTASAEFPTFQLDSSRVLPRWLHWHTKTQVFWEKCARLSHGTSGKNRIKPELFLTIEIPLPPLDEQHRIVARIEELAALIEEAQELRVKAREEAEALISSNVSSLPFDETYWGTVQNAVLDRKGTVRSGPFGSQLHHEEFVDSGVAAIGTRDVQVNRFDLNSGWYVTPEKFERFKRYQVFPGDVLVTIVGASIGRFCVVPEYVPLAFTTKHVIAVTLDLSIAEPWFVSYMLNFHSRCRESIFSQTEGSAQPSLNSKKVCAIALPLPPPDEQRRIVVYLDNLQTQVDELIAAQDATQSELEALLPSVLDQAFRGEL